MRLWGKEVNVTRECEVPRPGWLARLYLWVCERLYAELAWQYDVVSWLVSAGQWRRWQRGVWHEVRGVDLLEIGCGTGAMVNEGIVRGMSVVGLDRSPQMLAVAKRRVAREGNSAAFVQGDGRMLTFESGTFDCAIAIFPTSHIFEVSALREIHRVLRENGRLIVLGVWVSADLAGLEHYFPFFYGKPNADALAKLAQRVEGAGFAVRWSNERAGIFTVGTLVAERADALIQDRK